MTSLLLIAAPALLLFAVLFGRSLSGRKPTRRFVNVSTSLLLLLYFLATTGLGIFWVAKQELPAFDLHYLFGYITLLLVGIHVYVNWAAIRIRLHPRTARENNPATKITTWITRLKNSLPAAAIAGVLGFWIGTAMNQDSLFVCQQQPDSNSVASLEVKELSPAPQVTRQMIGNGENKIPLALYYHNATKNSRWDMSQAGLDWSQQPSVFKPYPVAQTLALPPPNLNKPDQTGEVIERQKRNPTAFQPGQMTAEDLSSILMLINGVTGTLEYPDVKYTLRSAPSAGALYPAITYVLVNTVEGIDPGLYHYDVQNHQLHRINSAPGLTEKLRAAVPMPVLLDNANVVFIYTANYYRSSWKYGKRAYRYILLDTGHVAKNALLGAETFGYQGNPIGCFDDQRINTLLQIDDNEEGALLLLPLGKGKEAPPITQKSAVQAAPKLLSGKADQLVLLAHGQTGLTLDHSHQTTGRTANNKLVEKSYPTLPVIDLPDTTEAGAPLTSTIMNRRSVRTWADKAMTQTQLSSLLYYSFGVKNENGTDLADPTIGGDRFLNLYLIIHRVEGIDPGVYYYNRRQHNLSQIQKGNFRRATTQAALAQSVVGQSCVCFVLTTSTARLDHSDGDRSLRYAGLEAGMIGENIYLQTEALGLGCTGIGAYFDDEVSELINVPPEEEAITYLLATGVKK